MDAPFVSGCQSFAGDCHGADRGSCTRPPQAKNGSELRSAKRSGAARPVRLNRLSFGSSSVHARFAVAEDGFCERQVNGS